MSISSKVPGTAKHMKQNPTHSIGQNIAYMISLAWRQRRSVILLALTMAATAILLSLTQLFIVPSILGAVEAKVSIAELTAIILMFTGTLILLSAAGSYFSSCSQFGRIEIRLIIGAMIQNKALTMSYPDIEDQNVRKKMDKASMLVASNSAATEAIWTTLMELLKNIVEFIVFLSLLATLNPLMIIAVLVTTIVSFSVSNYLNGWGYRHRDEESEYSRRMNYTSFLRTVFAFLDMPNKMEQGNMAVSQNCGKGYEIEFRNVSFKYPGQQNDALRNVSMTFRAGQRLAVVGMNGSGKTTFIKLLCRLYDPTEGEILLNGIDIRKYTYHEYMQLFSVVFQDFKLLSFELGQNVAGSMNVDLDKAEQCLRGAGFGIRLDKLPNGLSTAIYKDFDEKGVTISGGEAQKIALARALYKDAPFIILDEPTAALDPIAEFEVYSRMNQMIGEKSAVFISHRLASCRFCHDIAVFHEGRLIQRGSHDVLVSDKAGMYYRLWSAQAQYYGVED